MMNRYIAFIALFLYCAAGLSAQEDRLLERLYVNLTDNCVEMDYSYTVQMSGVRLNGNGTLLLQGEAWHMTGNGVEMWCDGETVWTVDKASKEVVIESAGTDESSDVLTNPAVLFVRLQDTFDLKETRTSADGKAMVFILHPKTPLNIEFVNVEVLKTDASLRGGSFALDDGTSVALSVDQMNLVDKKPAGEFRQPVSYDASWIVTDLR